MKEQQKITKTQEKYKQWLTLHEKLETAYQDLVKSTELMQELETFYFGGEYRELSEKIENGLQVDTTTAGEYSIMGEDTLWNAFHDQQTLLWKFLKLAVKELGKEH